MIHDLLATFARVKSALIRRGRTASDAEDLLHDAWLRLADYERDQIVHKPEAFLMRTALNLSIDAHRSRAAHGEEVQVEDVVLPDLSPSAESVLLARERLNRLSACLMRLPDKTRSIFLAHRLEGQTYQHIAREHGLAISSVERHVAKATLQLTQWMEGW